MTKLERLTAILLLLQDSPKSSMDIARQFEVSKRTVLRDIQALCEMGIPVIAREGAGGGYSLPGDYRVPPLPLTTREIFLLLLALGAVRQLSTTPYAAERVSLIGKLKAVLPEQDLRAAEHLLRSVRIEVPERTERAPLLEPLMAAANEGRWLRIDYQSAEKRSTQNILPRRLESQNGLWYCWAYSHERDEERVFRVDRIRALSPSRARFKKPPPSVPYDHPTHPEIRATFTARGVATAEVDPRVSSRIRRKEDGSGSFAQRCPPDELRWFARFFAGLCDDVEAHAPPELRRMLARMGTVLTRRYTETPEGQLSPD